MLDKVIELKFSDVPLPVFKKVSGKDYIPFGTDNKYPEFLLYLYNKSSKHNAIVNGKAGYIFGNGLKADTEDPNAKAFLERANGYGDSLDEVCKKTILDIELFGGFYWQPIRDQLGRVKDIYHIEFHKVRSNKDNSRFWYKNDWNDTKETAQEFVAFGTKDSEGKFCAKEIFFYHEYRPGADTYSLPNYIGSLNYIESDIEVSKHTLTNAKTGFSASKLVNFFNGEPEEEKKKQIQKRFEDRNTGSEGKKVIISFNNANSTAPTVQDLGTSDLTKEDFQQVDNLISQNIYAGHQVTSPMLFGIKTEGQLGGTTELRTAYDIFKNTYVTSKQQALEKVINFFAKQKGIVAKLSFVHSDPVGIQITDAIIAESLTKDEKRQLLGKAPEEQKTQNALVDVIGGLSPLLANKLTESMTQNEIRSIVGLAPLPNGDVIPTVEGTPAGQTQVTADTDENSPVNEHLKNLTGKQQQQLLRIIRQFSKGQLTKEQAVLLLQSSLGLNEADVYTLLGIDNEEQEFEKEYTEEEVAAMFAECGEGRDVFEIMQTRKVAFSTNNGCAISELELREVFEDAETIEDPEVKKKVSEIVKVTKKLPRIFIKYSYEPRPGLDPIIETTRPFCKKLVTLNRFYSRMEIERISERVGYSVWDRRGGFWGDRPTCRHIWKQHVVIKKG